MRMYANAHIGENYPISILKISNRDFLKMLNLTFMCIIRENHTPEWAETLNISSLGRNPKSGNEFYSIVLQTNFNDKKCEKLDFMP